MFLLNHDGFYGKDMLDDYQFVYFSNPYVGYEVAYKDLIEMENVRWVPQLPFSHNNFLIKLYKLHHKKRLNRLFPLPFKSLWYKIPLRKYKKSSKLVFIFNQLWSLDPVVLYVKKHFPQARLVLQISDAKEGYDELVIYEKRFKEIYDLIVTYDKKQAEKFGLSYFHNVHSYINPDKISTTCRSDVYFCGRAIDRLDSLIIIFELFEQKGLDVDFWITNVLPEKQRYTDKIHYNKPLTYSEHLQHLAGTKCVLYIQQGCAEAIEWRLILAVMMGKKIITNVKSIKEYSFYNPQDILLIENDSLLGNDSLDGFLTKVDQNISYDFETEHFSPQRLMEHIVKNLYL